MKKQKNSNIEKIKSIGKKKKLPNGFYMNKKSGHPSYKFAQRDRFVKSIGFTHNKYDFEEKLELKHHINPKMENLKKVYVLVNIQEQPITDYKKKSKYSDFRIHSEDKSTIDKIIKQNKHKKRK